MPGILGKRDIVFTFDPENFEKIFRTEGAWPARRGKDAFEHYRKTIRPEVFKGMGGLFGDQGEQWLKMRLATNPIMMKPQIVRSYVDPIDQVAREFIDKIKLMRDANDEMPDEFGNELCQWALETICLIALDQRLGVISMNKNPEAAALIKVH